MSNKICFPQTVLLFVGGPGKLKVGLLVSDYMLATYLNCRFWAEQGRLQIGVRPGLNIRTN